MPLIEALGEPILPGNCQDQNQKRKFVSLLLHLIAASLFLPLNGVIKGKRAERGGKYNAVQFLSATSEKPLTLQ
jgi:hypothetical protein